jgi:hypothetical protein
MTKKEFKLRWESDDDGGGITYEDIANCAKAWGLSSSPRIKNIDRITYLVLKEAKVVDAEDYNPELE